MKQIHNGGFVRLDAAMADDLSVVNSARVSFGRRKEAIDESDEGLIRFLMRERHGTPFEHNAFRFHVRCPIFIAREWQRHRIGCLIGETMITCVQPNGTPYKRTIEHIYRTKHGSKAPERWAKNGMQKNGKPARKLVPGSQRYRALNAGQQRVLRVLDEETGAFTTGVIADVWQTGVKQVYKVRTMDGHEVVASADHPFLTTEGWKKVADLDGTEVLLRQGRGSTIGVRRDRLSGKPELVGEEMTYDIEMAGPHHNYLANDLVVHNSFNEFSARYAEMPQEAYLPEPEYVRTQTGKPGAYTFEAVEQSDAERARMLVQTSYDTAFGVYERLLTGGIAKEIARLVLPVGTYTEFYWTVNARSLMNFLSLRSASTAQLEIQDYAILVEEHFAELMPVTHGAWNANGRIAP
jgi:thymidylate synthase ThyX